MQKRIFAILFLAAGLCAAGAAPGLGNAAPEGALPVHTPPPTLDCRIYAHYPALLTFEIAGRLATIPQICRMYASRHVSAASIVTDPHAGSRSTVGAFLALTGSVAPSHRDIMRRRNRPHHRFIVRAAPLRVEAAAPPTPMPDDVNLQKDLAATADVSSSSPPVCINGTEPTCPHFARSFAKSGKPNRRG